MTENPDASRPEPYVDYWARSLNKLGWIVASPKAPMYDNEESIGPLQDCLRKLKGTYRIDESRVVIVGHNAGAMMAWRMATRSPVTWAAVVALGGEISQPDRGSLKPLSGKPVYLFRGAADSYYTKDRMEADQKFLSAAKLVVTSEVKETWGSELPVDSLPKISEWISQVWPPGAYREKADEAEKALEAKDLPAAHAALTALDGELKKSPYTAFESRRKDLWKAFDEAFHGRLDEWVNGVEADPAGAAAGLEAFVKSLKGVKGCEAEAAKALAALKKDPRVVEALKKKQAEDQGAAWMEKAAALEAKGDIAKALEWCKKAAALAWSRQDEAKAKVAELEAKVGAK
jgi:predicted esterase